MRMIRMIAAGMAFVTVLAACNGGGDGQEEAVRPAVTDEAIRSAAEIDRESAVPAASTVARLGGSVEVFAEPGGAAPTTVLPATTPQGSARALLVLDERDGWLEVALPVRPNGSSGWIKGAGVERRTVDTAVVVDVEGRTLEAYVAGARVLETPIAVGADEYPTPRGHFFVTDLVAVPGGGGPYGPFALGLSAHSDTLTEFAGGDGQVGIHGTNDPASIGQAVSHGCIRVPNEVMKQLFELVSLGTPVLVG